MAEITSGQIVKIELEEEEELDQITQKDDKTTPIEIIKPDDVEKKEEVFKRNEATVNKEESSEILNDELQISPMKAIKISTEEHLLSDDDTPKVLTTLETVKKKMTEIITPRENIVLDKVNIDEKDNKEKPKDKEKQVEKPKEKEISKEKPREKEFPKEKLKEKEIPKEKPKEKEIAKEKPKEKETPKEKPKEKEIPKEKPKEKEAFKEKPREKETIKEKIEKHSGVKESKKEFHKLHQKTSEFYDDSIDDSKISEIARKQLESLNKVQKTPRPKFKINKMRPVSDDDDEPYPIEIKHLPLKQNELYVAVVNEKGESGVKLPCHILGRNKDNPENDLLSNGRNASKPRPGVKLPSASLCSPILSRLDVEQAINDQIKIKTKPPPKSVNTFQIIENRLLNSTEMIPISSLKTIDTSKSGGGIEIPQEFILGTEITMSNTIDTDNIDQDLIAILEGDDDETNVDNIQIKNESGEGDGEYQITFVDLDEVSKQNALIAEQKQADYDKECEREIALRQMMNLPKYKGKKTLKTEQNNKQIKKNTKTKPPASDLIDLLVQDWSDNELKTEENIVKVEKIENVEVKNEIPINVVPQQKNKRKLVSTPPITKDVQSKPIVIEVPPASTSIQPTFKRTRIIKKKIIWDPDAPETQFSYASLIQSSQPKKQIVKKAVIVSANQSPITPDTTLKIEKVTPPIILNNKRLHDDSCSPQSTSSTSTSIIKKKKLSEIDKLLGDEGAIKMIYSLERDNNNANLIENGKEMDQGDISPKKFPKQKVIRNVGLKQNINHPTQTTIVPRGRVKRELVQTMVTSTPRILNTKKDLATKKRAGGGQKSGANNESWDYVYKQRGGDDSMIIRRRSNSSYSSTTSPRRLSLDQSANTSATSITTNQDSSSVSEPIAKKMMKGKTFEFAKPTVKRGSINKIGGVEQTKLLSSVLPSAKTTTTAAQKAHSIIDDLKEKYSKVLAKTGVEIISTGTRRSARTHHVETPRAVTPSSSQKTINKVVDNKPKINTITVKSIETKEVLLTRHTNYAQLTLMYAEGEQLSNFITSRCLTELISSLKLLDSDDTCNAVLITNNRKICNGLDFTSLIQSNLEKKKVAAQELVEIVYDLLTILANFTKPLIIGLQQQLLSGFSVTILPLFDYIISDGQTVFNTNYNKIGQIPEGYSAVLHKNKITQSAITDLFLLNNSLTAKEALENGLITHIIKGTGFQQEILKQSSLVASQSAQALKSMRSVQKQYYNEKLLQSFIEEKTILIQNWTSNECQEKFKKYLINDKW